MNTSELKQIRRRHENCHGDQSESDSSPSSSSDTTSCNSPGNKQKEHDDVQEIKLMAQKDTKRVSFWRFIVTGSLFIPTIIVSVTTYKFLVAEQYRSFETAFQQFARTVGDAALEQQRNIRQAFKGLANAISASAQSSEAQWPFYTVPLFETYARNCLIQGRMEILTVFNLVKPEDRDNYEQWANKNYETMVQEGHLLDTGDLSRLNPDPASYKPYIFSFTETGRDVLGRDYYAATWSFSPPPISYGLVNGNLATIPDYGNAMEALLTLKNETIVTRVRPYSVAVGIALSKEEHEAMHSALGESQAEHPHSFFFHPIHKDSNEYNSEIVGVLGGAIAWDASMIGLLPDGVEGIQAVIQNDCGQIYTYEINGNDAVFLGESDLHDPTYEDKVVTIDLALHTHPNFTSTPGHCHFSMKIYPTPHFEAVYNTNTPTIFAGVVALCFIMVGIVFFIYDMFVQRRNMKLVMKAARFNAIVSSMVPHTFRDRLIDHNHNNRSEVIQSKQTSTLKSFMKNGGKDSNDQLASKPLADLFLEATVLFADIAGFTAWSSIREPTMVFALLETLYASFDVLAKRRKVFKVETVGDCYVAVTGIPDYHPDHVILMARFAQDLVVNMGILTKDLETTLGPDTGDLLIRIGMHCGSVTGGILRGEKPRFQLFGDTMNTASRMESTGLPGCIQISEHIAKVLEHNGKDSWLQKRDGKVPVKGKGEMQTYWLKVSRKKHSMASTSTSDSDGQSVQGIDGLQKEATSQKFTRLVGWNVEQLQSLLKQIIARRDLTRSHRTAHTVTSTDHINTVMNVSSVKKATPLEEVREIIKLPEFTHTMAPKKQQDPEMVVLAPKVIEQLTEYVTAVANMYRDNPFHNFEHCSHVVMSVIKLMSRIVATDFDLDLGDGDYDMAGKDDDDVNARKQKVAMTLHDHTYGITSDPLTQFACVFSALIHDVDHTGVPNTQVIVENPKLAQIYNNRSIAEQNSLDLAWELLMNPRYNDFRGVLCATEAELLRFRQLVVNSVMATDIVDEELKILRNARWEKAFEEEEEEVSQNDLSSLSDGVNRKATIVIEHLIQASDVSHTMKHWHVYRKWNENLFEEMYRAYQLGRGGNNDPSEFWYKGEIGFFDFYIIPLAKKLKDCGVFGKTGDEYLNYAKNNRYEWESRGQQIVAEMIEKFALKYQTNV